jgi:hypothetical protein
MSGCELPFWKDPAVLIRDFNLSYEASCDESKYNFAGRLVILAIAFGLVGMPVAGAGGFFVAIGFAAVVAAIIILSGNCTRPGYGNAITNEGFIANGAPMPKVAVIPKRVKETFIPVGSSNGTIVSNIMGVEAKLPYNDDAAPYSGAALPEQTLPTARNLFMNVLLDEYKYNPERPAAAPVTDPLVKQTLDDYFRVQWFSDPTDVFGKNQNQRQFVTQPSTSVPNDRESYQNWLYKIPGKTCKEAGGAACLSGTDGSPVTWLNQQY